MISSSYAAARCSEGKLQRYSKRGLIMDNRSGMMRRVIVESPLSAPTEHQLSLHVEYARQCMTDCLKRGESPFASHLLYPQILDDNDPIQRELGMAAGFCWMHAADYIVVYTDFGISGGMKAGIKQAQAFGLEIKYRSLDANSNTQDATK